MRSGSDLRAAVVGLGKMGLLHACILNVLPNVKVVGLCEKSSLVRKAAGKALRNVASVDDVSKLAGLDIDFVYVTTPIPSHFPIVRTIFSEGISPNVFVEKTLAASFEKAIELCRLAEKSGGANMVGYMKRYAVTFRKAKEILDEEAIGELVSFSAYAYSSDFELGNRSRATGARGGVLGDLGSHVVELALWFFGGMQVLSSATHSLVGFDSEDQVSFRVKTSGGLLGAFDVSWCMKGYRTPEFGLRVEGSKGSLSVSDDEVKLNLLGGESKVWYRHDLNDNVGFLLGASEYYREDEQFVLSVMNKTRVEPSFQSAAVVDCLLDEVKRRAEAHER